MRDLQRPWRVKSTGCVCGTIGEECRDRERYHTMPIQGEIQYHARERYHTMPCKGDEHGEAGSQRRGRTGRGREPRERKGVETEGEGRSQGTKRGRE